MFNVWSESEGHNHVRPASTHELDGVTFRLANSASSYKDQLLHEALQKMNSTNLGKLDQYIYDFKLEERVLAELKTASKRQ